MKKAAVILFLFFLTIPSLAQNAAGNFSLGARSTFNFFNEGASNEVGLGTGGQFRIRLSDRVNTEWYADFIQTNIQDQANRTDYHIGWSVFYYLRKNQPQIIQPFVEAGHCFDYTNVRRYSDSESLERWSAAVQMGGGTHFNLSDKFDFTLKAQYMIHIGAEIHTHLEDDILHLEEKMGTDLEGHLLVTASVNYKIAKLWNRQK